MQEISVKGNDTGLRVFIDGELDISLLPESDLNALATVLESVLSKQYENYVKRKSYTDKKQKVMPIDNT